MHGRVFGMSQSDSRGLVLGALAGAAGLTLAVVWYQSRRAGAGRMVAQELYLNSNDHHVGASVSVAWAGQREVLDRLGALIQCVSELKEEVRALKAALPLLQDHVRDELQGGSRRAAESRRATPTRKRRTAGPSARQDGQSSEDAGSEGGYMTAMTDSEEEDKKGREAKEEEEEEEEDENQEEPDELSILLESADALHAKETERGVGLAPLLERRGQFEQDYAFMWRLARAYSDAHDMAQDREEKKSMAESEVAPTRLLGQRSDSFSKQPTFHRSSHACKHVWCCMTLCLGTSGAASNVSSIKDNKEFSHPSQFATQTQFGVILATSHNTYIHPPTLCSISAEV
ncbi:regulator of microtubule dynamics protein 2 isoform X3 [Clupea harengus]|uniref:Regulator of microtubule dynamics protein 2 isoform X3 n=1 Tax=Clupea harengus TaxID=7950 RepID=A0A6P8GCI1_CLUHA|nr:regulator of microtubule dynamics protein 2 isoform X3 [Clupea harengus]